MSDVIYVYGFVSAASPAPPPGLHGLDDAPVRLFPGGRIAAVTSALPAAAYAAAAVEARLEDLSWLAPRGVAHERVVAWFVDHAEILPAPLLTLYSGGEALARALAEREAGLAGELARLAGRREWDLKIACDRAELERHAGSVAPAVRALDEQIATSPAGRRYLLERKRADLLRRELDAAARQLAASLLAELRAGAEHAVVLEPPRAAGALPVLLAAALLVGREREPELRALAAERAAELSHIGITVELTGPWAPYRFLDAERLQPA